MRPLAPRELEVLKLVSQGMSNAEIATDTGISEQTIKNYLVVVYLKIGARNRAHAVAIAIEQGLI